MHKVSASTGGEKSKMYWYYMTRNRLIFNKKFNNTIFYKMYFLATTAIKLIKYLLNISDEKILDLNLPTGTPLVFEIDENLNIISAPELF